MHYSLGPLSPVPIFFISYVEVPCIFRVLCPSVPVAHILWPLNPRSPCPHIPGLVPLSPIPCDLCTLVPRVPFSCVLQVVRPTGPLPCVSSCSRVLHSLCSKLHILCFHNLCAILCIPYTQWFLCPQVPISMYLCAVDLIMRFIFCELHDQCLMFQIPSLYVQCLPCLTTSGFSSYVTFNVTCP